MSIPPYTAGYPLDGSSLGSSKSVIRNNLDGEFQVFSVDHYNQNGVNPGFHQQSTYPNVGFAPTTVSGQLALYSKSIGSGKSALFMIRDGSAPTETQLTNPNIVAPKPVANGYTFLPGGLILQYGEKIIAFPAGSPSKGVATVTFPFTFPTNMYNIQLTPEAVSTSPNSALNLYVMSNTLSTFTIFYLNNSSASGPPLPYQNFFWTAIGK